MIELRGLHLGNIARSPAESVRPDLWPDHAWVPALGCTGAVLHDLCGQRPAVGAATLGWSRGSSGYGVFTTLSGAYQYPLQTNISRSWSLPWTAVVVAAPTSSDVDCRAFGCWTVSGQTGGWAIWYDVGGAGPSWSMAFARKPSSTTYYQIIGNNSPSGGVGLQSVAIGGWRGGTSAGQWFLCVDGASVTDSVTSGGDPIYPGDTTATVFALGERANSPFVGVTAANMLYWRALSINQSLDLTADPLLPFRRRQPVFYSVPSGGGSTRNLIAALTGESATGTISAIIARALSGDVTATSITGAITASMARDLLASLQWQSTTGDIAAILQRLLLAGLGAASTTGDVATTTARALLANLQAESATPDIAATLAALVALTASISGTTTTPAVAATMARAIAASLAGQSTTGAITIQFAGLLLLVASIAGASTTGALTATTTRELRAAIDAASASGQVDGQLLRQIAATVAGASVTGTIAAELVNLVSLAASVVGASITPDVVAALQRGLAADVAAGSTTGAAAVTVARTLAAAVEAGSLTPDNLVLILTGLGILHDTTIISRTPRRGITSRTVRRTIHSA